MQNTQYLLMCRSLTYAQRSARLLERSGITAVLTRLPRAAAERGCGYGVLVAPKNRDRALELLTAAGLPPRRLYLRGEDGSVREVSGDDLS